MSDLSTPEEIRAEVIRALVGHEPTEDVYLYCTCGVRIPDGGYGAHIVDALAAAGMLVTGVEGRYIGRGLLRRTRYVTDWREPEVTE